jgi:3-oxoacyl-[acyl-carrier-protein] synthase II
MLGAAAAFETIVSALALFHSVVPPTMNLEVPDPDCDLDYVPGVARERRMNVVLNNSFGFGGQNATLLLRSV